MTKPTGTSATNSGLLAIAAAAAVLLAACSSPVAPASVAPAKVQTKDPVTVNVGQAILTVGAVGMYVAIEKGFYTEQNVTFNLIQLQSGSTATQAIASGSVDFVNAGSFDVATAVSKGVPLQAFATIGGIGIETCVSTELAQTFKLTSTSTVAEVMSALKGRTVGITGPNSAPDLVLRYLLQKHANLKPDADVKIVSLGSIPAELTALGRGQIDAFLQSPPACEQAQAAGTGVPLVRPSQFTPDMQGMPLGVLYTRKEYIQAHENVISRVAAATAKGGAFAKSNTDETLIVLKKYFPTVEDATLRDTLVNIVQPTLSADGKMSQAEWTKVSNLLRTSGAIDKDLDTQEGGLWTNAYLP
jgi:ABC-type nitrate/sulfonate/bicarbonate transport system substrate-binding protein